MLRTELNWVTLRMVGAAVDVLECDCKWGNSSCLLHISAIGFPTVSRVLYECAGLCVTVCLLFTYVEAGHSNSKVSSAGVSDGCLVNSQCPHLQSICSKELLKRARSPLAVVVLETILDTQA